jgi:TolB-like protein
MAEALKGLRARAPADAAGPVRARSLARLIVLPFRSLRPDAETDFLAVSLPDAISGALASIDSLVVRSRISAPASAEAPDLKAIARDAGVDAVVTGTLLRDGERVRVSAQLLEAPSGTVMWSRTVEGALGDLFALQDSIVHEILDSLTVKLSRGEEERLGRGAAATARAYELYLRGNQVAVSWVQESGLLAARDLYRACLDVDPEYAPAWARVARVYRILAKYGFGDTQERYRRGRQAIMRALELDRDLPLAHHVFTYFQVEEGEAREAMRRLLERARTRDNEPQVFAGLVPALRFCGLLTESLAAHDRARRLDPTIRTGVSYTYLALGDHERVIATDDETPPFGRFVALDHLGRSDEAREELREETARGHEGLEGIALRMTLAALDQDRDAVRAQWERMQAAHFRDPEGWYLMTRNLARVGEVEMALDELRHVVDHGFHCPSLLDEDPWLAPLRAEPELYDLLDRARAGRAAAEAEFVKLGGGEVLGLAMA